MNPFRILLLAGLIAQPLAVHAADVKVDYLLETKPFKAAIAGTPLTVSLFTDAACAGAPAATELVNVEALQLIEPLKRTNPKAASSPRAPRGSSTSCRA